MKNKENTQKQSFWQTIATLLMIVQIFCVVFTAVPTNAQQQTQVKPSEQQQEVAPIKSGDQPAVLPICPLGTRSVNCYPEPTPTPEPTPQPTPPPVSEGGTPVSRSVRKLERRRIGFTWMWIPIENYTQNFTIASSQAQNDAEIAYVNSLPSGSATMTNLAANIQAGGPATVGDFWQIQNMTVASMLSFPAHHAAFICEYDAGVQTFRTYNAQLLGGVTIETSITGQQPISRVRLLKNGNQEVGRIDVSYARTRVSWDLVSIRSVLTDGNIRVEETVNVPRNFSGGDYIPRNGPECFNQDDFELGKTSPNLNSFQAFQAKALNDEFSVGRKGGPSNNVGSLSGMLTGNPCEQTYKTTMNAIQADIDREHCVRESVHDVSVDGAQTLAAGLAAKASCAATPASGPFAPLIGNVCRASAIATAGFAVGLGASVKKAYDCFKTHWGYRMRQWDAFETLVNCDPVKYGTYLYPQITRPGGTIFDSYAAPSNLFPPMSSPFPSGSWCDYHSVTIANGNGLSSGHTVIGFSVCTSF